MASNFGLSIPEPSTPTKSMTASTDNLSLSSPSSIKSGSDSSIVNTGGIPIATLRTPTKGSANQNIAPKQPIMMSPPKLYIKGNLGGIRGTSVAQLIQTTSTGAGAGQTPVYQAVSNGQNGRVQYVKLVTDSSSGAIPTRQIITQVRPLQQKVVTSVAAAASTGTQQQFIQQNIQSATGTQTRPATTVIRQQSAAATPVGQRVILPAATPHQTIRITGTQSLAHIKSQLPIGATILSSNDSSGQMLAFLPNNQSIIQQKTPVVKQVYPGSGASSHPTSRLQEIRHESLLHPQHTSTAETPPTHLQIPPTTSSDVKQKKPCNCTKSQCLKLYCDCFANGEFCSNCNCQNCFNNLEHEEERQKAVKQCLDRNPQAFHPKIGKGTKTDGRRHQKGCNCKRSGCLKNYCECFEAKIPCGSICKCVGCKNNESADSKSLMSLADAADMRHSQAVAAGNHRLPYHDIQQPAVHNAQNPHAYLKKDVIGAIMDCLIAQCREAESAKCNESTTEKVILEEFGRCLNDVIKASAQQTKPY